MTQFIELTGRTEADAIAQALTQLGLERDDIRVEVLERAKTGFLGFGSKPAKIRVSYEEKVEPVNLYADIKAEEAQENQKTAPSEPQTLEATQSINTEQLATMLDQSSLVTEMKEETPASSDIPPVSSELEETSNIQEPQEVQEATVQVEQQQEQSSQTSETVEEKSQEFTDEAQEKPPENLENQEKTEETKEVSQENQNTQNTQDISDTLEKPQESEQKEKKLTKKERENLTEEEQDALTKEIERFLSGLLVHLQVTATPSVSYQGLTVKVRLDGEGLATLIGKRGETLDAIQQITGYVVMRTCKKRVRLFLDAENYRAKREETLIKLANKVAGEAVKNKRNVPLEPMNAYERHIIHEALSEHPNVFTYSTGSEPNRCTVVAVHGRKGNKSRKR